MSRANKTDWAAENGCLLTLLENIYARGLHLIDYNDKSRLPGWAKLTIDLNNHHLFKGRPTSSGNYQQRYYSYRDLYQQTMSFPTGLPPRTATDTLMHRIIQESPDVILQGYKTFNQIRGATQGNAKKQRRLIEDSETESEIPDLSDSCDADSVPPPVIQVTQVSSDLSEMAEMAEMAETVPEVLSNSPVSSEPIPEALSSEHVPEAKQGNLPDPPISITPQEQVTPDTISAKDFPFDQESKDESYWKIRLDAYRLRVMQEAIIRRDNMLHRIISILSENPPQLRN